MPVSLRLHHPRQHGRRSMMALALLSTTVTLCVAGSNSRASSAACRLPCARKRVRPGHPAELDGGRVLLRRRAARGSPDRGSRSACRRRRRRRPCRPPLKAQWRCRSGCSAARTARAAHRGCRRRTSVRAGTCASQVAVFGGSHSSPGCTSPLPHAISMQAASQLNVLGGSHCSGVSMRLSPHAGTRWQSASQAACSADHTPRRTST